MEARRSTVAGALLGSRGPRRSRKAFRAATLPRHGPCESVASRLNGHGRRRALLRLGVKRAAGQHWRRLARATWVEPSLWVDHSQWGQGRWAEAVAGPAPPRGNDVPSRPEPPRRSGQAGGFCHCYGTGAAEGAPAVGAHAGRVDGRPPRPPRGSTRSGALATCSSWAPAVGASPGGETTAVSRDGRILRRLSSRRSSSHYA